MCTDCGRTFKYPNPLKSHLRFHCRRHERHQSGARGAAIHNSEVESEMEANHQLLRNDFRLKKSNLSAYRPGVQRTRLAPSHDTPCNYLQKHVHNIKQEDGLMSTKRASRSPSMSSPSKTTPPIQIFNHIHAPPTHMPFDYMAMSYYYTTLQHQMRIGMGIPVLPPMIPPTNMRVHHRHMMNQQHTEVHHTDAWQQYQQTPYQRPTESRQKLSKLQPHNRQPPSPIPERTSPLNDACTSQLTSSTPAAVYNIPLLSENEGEPLDLLPRSMYMNKSRKGHICVYCGKLYSRKYGLKIHLRTHTGYKPLKCKVCLRPFGDPSNLNKHIRLHAEGDTPYRCPHCGKVLVRRRDLDRHLSSRHPDKFKGRETIIPEVNKSGVTNITECREDSSATELNESIDEIDVT